MRAQAWRAGCRTGGHEAKPAAVVAVVVVVAADGPCVEPECPAGEVESDVACGADEDEADCHVVEGGPCGGAVTCRPADDGE